MLFYKSSEIKFKEYIITVYTQNNSQTDMILIDQDFFDLKQIDFYDNQFAWQNSAWEELFSVSDYQIITITLNKKIIAFSLSKLLKLEEMMHVIKLVVSKKNQNNGIGKILMKQICDEAIFLKFKKIFLEVSSDNIFAIRLYEKFGLDKIYLSKNYYSNGQNAFKMLKNI